MAAFTASGQRNACFNWNLVAKNTREGDVYRTLLDKLNEAREALGGKVFDVLGQLFADRPLRDLLIEAIRQDDSDTTMQVERDVEMLASLDRYREIVERHALAKEALGPDRLRTIRSERARAEISRLVPYVVASFFVEAFRELGGTIEEREPGRYAISAVPLDLRRRGRSVGPGITDRYGRICFDKDRIRAIHVDVEDRPGGRGRNGREAQEATLIAPGHPLFDLTIDVLCERHGGLLRRGAVLLDPRLESDTMRILMCIETQITDERADAAGRRQLASAELRFVEIGPDRQAREADAAPHLDYRALDEAERVIAAPLLAEGWIRGALEIAEAYAVEHLLPPHLELIKREREDAVLKARDAIDTRLTDELWRLSDEIATLRQQERAGRQPKMNVDRAQRQYEELEGRRLRRLRDLDRQLRLTPEAPRVVAAAVVVPIALLAELRGDLEGGRARSDDTAYRRSGHARGNPAREGGGLPGARRQR